MAVSLCGYHLLSRRRLPRSRERPLDRLAVEVDAAILRTGMAVLHDLLEPNLKVVFCGTAAGHASAKARAYYAGRGNRFWPTLFVSA